MDPGAHASPSPVAATPSQTSRLESTGKTSPQAQAPGPVFEDGRVTVCVRERPFLPQELRAGSSAPKPATAPAPLSCLVFADDGETLRILDPAMSVDSAPTTTPPTRPLGASTAPEGPASPSSAGGGRFGDAGHVFRFDHAYPMHVPQSQVYADMGTPVLNASFRGFNTCIFAYGQTGSGKSYSMMGADGGADIDSEPGLVPRLCAELFERIAATRLPSGAATTPERGAATLTSAAPAASKVEITVRVSYLEIYKEKVRSLLAGPDAASTSPTPDRRGVHGAPSSSSASRMIKAGAARGAGIATPDSDNLRVRQHPTLGVFVEGLQERAVTSHEEMLHWMKVGNTRRRTAATRMNDVSSRSHAIFAVQVVQKRSATLGDGRVQVTERRAKINLVDLAGSERANATGAVGDTLREGAQINLSLTTLGRVIKALAELSTASAATASKSSVSGARSPTPPPAPTRHIPYRDSTLTFLLQESLGGSSKTYMLATLSPAVQNYEETLSTLRYADRAKSIVTRAFVNESASDKRIRELEEEVRHLREQIRQLQGSGLSATHAATLEQALSATLMGAQSPEVRRLYEEAEAEPAEWDRQSPRRGAPAEEKDEELAEQVVEEEHVHGDKTPVAQGSTPSTPTRTSSPPADAPPASAPSADESDGWPDTAAAASAPVPAETLLEDAMDADDVFLPPAGTLSSPLAAEVEQLQSALRQAQEVIHQLTDGDKNRETPRPDGHTLDTGDANTASVVATTALTVARRGDQTPYLLNVDGVGDWVVSYLSTTHDTVLGREDADVARRVASGGGSYLAVPTDLAEGVLPAHLCFRVEPDDAVVLHTAAEKESACVSVNGASPVTLTTRTADVDSVSESGVVLRSGDVVRVGARQWSLRLMGPRSGAAPPRDVLPPSLAMAAPMPDTLVGTETRHEARRRRPSVTSASSGTALSSSVDVTPLVPAPHDEEEEDTLPSADAEPLLRALPVMVVPRLALDALRRPAAPPPQPALASPTLSTRTTAAPSGVAPLSTLPLTARGTRPRWDVLDAAGDRGSREPLATGTVPHQGNKINSTSSAAAGRARPLRGAVLTEPARFVGQHTLCFVGAPGVGKTCTRENLREPDRWYNFLVKPTLAYPPTWGLERVAVDVEGQQDMRLVLAELSGQPCFNLLTDFIPWRRVTFVLCFSLEHQPSLPEVRQTVELLLCHTERRPIALLLVATHMDKCQLPRTALNHLLEDLEGQIRNLCVMLQPNPDLRPIIIGRAAVNNLSRDVLMAGFGKVDSFPKLLTWLSDYAYHQCRNDPDFPNGMIPERCLQVRHQLTRLRLSRRFSLSARDYRQFAATLYPSQYGVTGTGDLALHTQLLTSWGIVLHLDKNECWRQNVVLDVKWLHLILSVLASLGRTAPTAEEEEAAAQSVAMTYNSSLSTSERSTTTHTVAPVRGSILLSSTTMRRLMRCADNRPTGPSGASSEGVSEGREIPFSPQKVITADTFGLLRHSIPTVPVLAALMEKLIREHSDDAQARHLSGIIEVLENCDALIRGSRLLYSPTQRRYRLLRAASHPQGAGDDGGDDDADADSPSAEAQERAEWDAAQAREFFFLLPFTFSAAAPPPVVQHFSKFLSGPFYRFTFNVIPQLFFAKLIARLARVASSNANPSAGEPAVTPPRKIYMGPLDPVMVEAHGAVLRAGGARPADGDAQRVIIPSGHLDPWATCAWVAADEPDETVGATATEVRPVIAEPRPSRSRVLLRLVHHSLFLSFHNVYETEHDAGGGSPPRKTSASYSSEEEPEEEVVDYDPDLDLDSVSSFDPDAQSRYSSSVVSSVPDAAAAAAAAIGRTRLRDAAFFQGVLDTVRAVAEEYPGTECEESILSTTTPMPAPYGRAWLEDDGDVKTHAHSVAHGEAHAQPVPVPFYHTVDANLNSAERLQAREETSLLTARLARPHQPAARFTQTTHNEDDVDDEEAAVFPFLRAHLPLHMAASPLPTDRVRQTLASAQRHTNTTLAPHPSGATLLEVLSAVNESLALDDAVQHSQVLDALLDVLSRADNQ